MIKWVSKGLQWGLQWHVLIRLEYRFDRVFRDRDVAGISYDLSLLSRWRMSRLILSGSADYLLPLPPSVAHTNLLFFCGCIALLKVCHYLILTACTYLLPHTYVLPLTHVLSLTYVLSPLQVGEGLCPRGGDSSTAMSIQTAALGNDGDIFVGGSFESRVWDGHHFVNVYHVAHFDGISKSTLSILKCLQFAWTLLMHLYDYVF